MKPEFETLELVKNEADKQFELTVEGHKAFIQFHEIADRYFRAASYDVPVFGIG